MIWPLSWAWTTQAWQERAEVKARENHGLVQVNNEMHRQNNSLRSEIIARQHELAMYKRFVANLRLDQDELQSRMDEAR